MKTKVRKKKKSMVWILMFLLTFFVVTEAKAHWRHYHNVPVPVAICATGGTHVPLPYFVCCQKIQNGHQVWKDTWVATSCKNADPLAVYDMGCKTTSPVFETGMPMTAECQFSHSTGKFI